MSDFAFIPNLVGTIAERVPMINAMVWKGFVLSPIAPETLERARGSLGKFELLAADQAAARLAGLIGSTAATVENVAAALASAAVQVRRLVEDARHLTDAGIDDFAVQQIGSHLAASDRLLDEAPAVDERDVARIEALARLPKAAAPIAHLPKVREQVARVAEARTTCRQRRAELELVRAELADLAADACRRSPDGEIAALKAQMADFAARIAALQGSQS